MARATVSERNLIMSVCVDISGRYPDLQSISPDELTHDWRAAGHQYLVRYDGSNKFLRDVQSKLPLYPVLTPRQCRAVLIAMVGNYRQWRNANDVLIDATGDYVAVPKLPEEIQAQRDKQDNLWRVVSPIQCGIYTVELSASEHVTIQIKPYESRDNRTHVVSYLAGSDNMTEYVGMAWIRDNVVNIWSKYRNTPRLIQALHMWLAGESVLSAAHCNRCGRLLTVPTSLHAGYGPECIKKVA